MRDIELQSFLEKPVDVIRLVDKLTFDLDDLETAALKQPKLRLEAGRFKAQTVVNLSTLKRRLSRIVGKKSIRIRRRSERITEGAVKNSLSLDDKVQSAQKKLDRAEGYYEIANQLVEAYKERTMMIAVLTKLRASEISSTLASVKGESEMKALRHRANKVRESYADLEND